VADEAPELYQLVGAALRDVAQARFMSDTFSKQISFVYEADSVLRRFPVPRVDIDEAEITLHFAIKEVAIDPARHSSRNSAIGSLFDQYSVRIVRETMQAVRGLTRRVSAAVTDEGTRAAIATFERRFLSDDNRELLTGRLLQYFNESVDNILRDDGTLDVAAVMGDLDSDVNKTVFAQPEVKALQAHFAQGEWQQFVTQARDRCQKLIEELGGEIAKLRDKYPDYRITVDPNAAAQAAPGAPISSIKIKSTVRNYKWAKVDVDDADMRNVRTLSPE
jgi:hypothetical protein